MVNGRKGELTSPQVVVSRSSFSVRHGLQPARMCARMCARRRAERISDCRAPFPLVHKHAHAHLFHFSLSACLLVAARERVSGR
jgi:hypothetical protein